MKTTRTRRAGFTIVEMLMVIGILAVLMGLVTTAASAAIRQSRNRRTEATKQVIQSGIATYRAQKNFWPPKGGKLQSWADDGVDSGDGLEGDTHVAFLSTSDYDKMMRELASASVKDSSPMMDFGGVMVASASAAGKDHGRGRVFAEEVRKKSGKKLKLSEMVFGYITKDGYFRRYLVQYNAESDTVTVMTRDDFSTWWNVAHGGKKTVKWPTGY